MFDGHVFHAFRHTMAKVQEQLFGFKMCSTMNNDHAETLFSERERERERARARYFDICCTLLFSQKILLHGQLLECMCQGDGLSLAELQPLIVPQYQQIMEQEAQRAQLVSLVEPLLSPSPSATNNLIIRNLCFSGQPPINKVHSGLG